MRRLVVACVVAVALAGCIQAADGPDGRDGVDDVAGDSAGAEPYAYRLAGCTLFEGVLPGDWTATEAALPAGYTPVDYGAYWGGPDTGDSAVSLVWWDCPTYADGDVDRGHRELFVGAYVEVAADDRPVNATPFYLFDVAASNPAYRDALGARGWTPMRLDGFGVQVGAAGDVAADAGGQGWSANGSGTFPAGDRQTGTFAFENHHVVGAARIEQRMAFSSFSYRTGPVEVSVAGVEPLTAILGDDPVQGTGFHGWGVAANVTVERVPR